MWNWFGQVRLPATGGTNSVDCRRKPRINDVQGSQAAELLLPSWPRLRYSSGCRFPFLVGPARTIPFLIHLCEW